MVDARRCCASELWVKSTYSQSEAACVEVAMLGLETGIRDSKNPEAGHLMFGDTEWAAFLQAVKNSEVAP
ncbi:hypothetical protein GCM10009605_34910 [Nocardiopsis composta]